MNQLTCISCIFGIQCDVIYFFIIKIYSLQSKAFACILKKLRLLWNKKKVTIVVTTTKFFRSDGGLTLNTSVLETLNSGQFTLSTYLTDAKLSCSTPSPPPPLTQHHSISIHLPFLNLIRQRLLIDASRTESELELFDILSNLIEIKVHYNSTVDRLLFLSKKLIFLLRFRVFFVLFFFFFSKSCAKMNENSKRYLSLLVQW